MYNKALLLTLATSLFFFGLSGAHADDAKGKELYTAKGCTACHGVEGKSPIAPTYPKLNGQSKEYLFQQLKDFKSGKRTNSQAVLMKGIVQAIDESDLESIATYLSNLGAQSTDDKASKPTDNKQPEASKTESSENK